MGCSYKTSTGELANLALVVYLCLNHFTGITQSAVHLERLSKGF